MASMMASTLDLSRPSEKLGTHSTSVDISRKNIWVHYVAQGWENTRHMSLPQRSQRTQRKFLGLFAAEESSDTQSHLHRVDSWIRRRQACIGDVQVAHFQAHVIFRAEDVRTEGGLWSEVHGVSACRDIVVGEERAAAEFEIRGEAAVTFEVPLEPERIEAYAVGSVGGLED